MQVSSPAPTIGPAKGRIGSACRICRRRKVKCSGTAPCSNCTTRGQRCVFDEAERRVVVLERHLRALQRKAAATDSDRSPRADQWLNLTNLENEEHDISLPDSVQPEDEREEVQKEALDNTNQSTVQDEVYEGQGSEVIPIPGTPVAVEATVIPHFEPKRSDAAFQHTVVAELDRGTEAETPQLSYLAFARAARQLLDPTHTPEAQFAKSGSYVHLLRNRTRANLSSIEVPSKDHVIFLCHVVDFHLRANLVCFDSDAFLQQLETTFPQHHRAHSPVWPTLLLIVIALGKLFQEKESLHPGPPGFQEFVQGIDVLPSSVELENDPQMATEAICLLSFYARAVGLHNLAYLYAGQAARLLKSSGLIRSSPALDDFDSQPGRVQMLHRTAQTLDWHAAETLCLIPDLTLQLPTRIAHLGNSAIELNHDMAMLLIRKAPVPIDISSGNSGDMDNLVDSLMAMSNLGRRIHEGHRLCNSSFISSISKEVAMLHLSYCRGIIILVRPLLIMLIKCCLAQAHPFAAAGASSGPVFKAFRTGANAATFALNILYVLQGEGMLEAFSFLGQETTFLAAVYLFLAHLIAPDITDSCFTEKAKSILHYMERKGNENAVFLRTELHKISLLGQKMSNSVKRDLHPDLTGKKIFMIEDGILLHNAILDIVELRSLECLDGDTVIPERTPSFVDSVQQALFAGPTFQSSGRSNTQRLDEIYLQDDVVGNPLSFDFGDLQWLESVQ